MMRFCFIVLLLVIADLACARVSDPNSCPLVSFQDAILGFPDSFCALHHGGAPYEAALIEGDEASLQKALHLVYSLSRDYVAVLFYASCCPFSRNFRPSFSVLSSLYPSIPHFAIEESAVRPSLRSTLSKYGVHGFPTLLLLNSTMRVRYRGPRSLKSLVTFYGDVTGKKSDIRDEFLLDKIEAMSKDDRNDKKPENCPFSWARSPENLLQQESYLALATTFVLMRLLYLAFPYLLEFASCTRRRCVGYARIGTFWEHPLRYLNRAKQVYNAMKDPCKGRNFQEGAINARAWASKSLASAVAIGDPSSGTSRSATAKTSPSH